MKKLCVLIVCLFAVNVWAQEDKAPLVTDRPTQAASSTVVPINSLQIETGFGLTGNEAGDTEYKTYSLGTTLLRYGLLENAELRFGFNYNVFKTSSSLADTTLQGFTPIEIGTKIYIAKENGWLPEVAVLASLTLPSGSEEFKANTITPSLFIAASHTISDNIGLGYNIGTVWDGVNPEAIGKYSIGLGWSPIDNLGVFGEFYGTFGDLGDTHSFNAGLTYLLTPNFQLDTSFGFDLSDDADDFFVGAGLSWRIPR